MMHRIHTWLARYRAWRTFSGLLLALWVGMAHAGSFEDFFIAVNRDDVAAVRGLLQRGFDPNTRDEKGLTGLFLAMRAPSPQVASLLMAWPGTDVDARSPHDETPLMMAALKGNLAAARELIDKDADVNKTGWTPLHYAATAGNVPMVALMLDQHAYIDAESPNGSTPLMLAAQYGTLAAVQHLLEAGADPTLKNQLGLTAVDFALRVERKDVAEAIAAEIRRRQPVGKW